MSIWNEPISISKIVSKLKSGETPEKQYEAGLKSLAEDLTNCERVIPQYEIDILVGLIKSAKLFYANDCKTGTLTLSASPDGRGRKIFLDFRAWPEEARLSLAPALPAKKYNGSFAKVEETAYGLTLTATRENFQEAFLEINRLRLAYPLIGQQVSTRD